MKRNSILKIYFIICFFLITNSVFGKNCDMIICQEKFPKGDNDYYEEPNGCGDNFATKLFAVISGNFFLYNYFEEACNIYET